MVDEGLIGALMVVETIGYRRALFGRPPSRPMRVFQAAVVCLAIHLGFHAAATVAPSAPTAVAFVLAGWTTFILWLKWMARAPKPFWGEGEDGGGGPPGGGGPGGGDGPDQPDSKPSGGGREIDWDALEREMDDFLNGDRELAGAR